MTPSERLEAMKEIAHNCARAAELCALDNNFAAMRAWLVEQDIWLDRIARCGA